MHRAASRFRFQSGNTPLNGWELHGRVERTIVAGEVRYEGGPSPL